MANKDMPKGAEAHGRLYEQTVYVAQSTIYPGDLVKRNAAGTVEAAAAGDALLGVASNYAAAGAEVLVADHPDQRFTIQCNGAEVDAQTDIGLNASIVVGTASAKYKRSAMQLDSSTLATTATLALKVLGLDRSVDNAPGAKARVIVRINNHQNAAGTGTAGV